MWRLMTFNINLQTMTKPIKLFSLVPFFLLLIISDQLIAQNTDGETLSSDPEIYDVVDRMPKFLGNINGFSEYLSINLQYPEKSKELKEEGKVFIQFVVWADGRVGQVKTIKGLSNELDKEAERVVRSSPIWRPAEVDDKPVAVRMILPVEFQITSEE